MNSPKILAAIAIAIVLAANSGGATAETYEGVTTVHSVTTRAEVHAQALVAAHEDNPYADSADSGVNVSVWTDDRLAVHAGADAKAHDPLQSLDRRAFYRDQIPAQYSKPSPLVLRQARD